MTILRLAHMDLEGLVMDTAVRSLRDQVWAPPLAVLLLSDMF